MNNFKALDRNEMKQVKGGSELCIFKINGVRTQENSEVVEGGSAGANQMCVDYIQAHPGSRCGYDCDGDGWGH